MRPSSTSSPLACRKRFSPLTLLRLALLLLTVAGFLGPVRAAQAVEEWPEFRAQWAVAQAAPQDAAAWRAVLQAVETDLATNIARYPSRAEALGAAADALRQTVTTSRDRHQWSGAGLFPRLRQLALRTRPPAAELPPLAQLTQPRAAALASRILDAIRDGERIGTLRLRVSAEQMSVAGEVVALLAGRTSWVILPPAPVSATTCPPPRLSCLALSGAGPAEGGPAGLPEMLISARLLPDAAFLAVQRLASGGGGPTRTDFVAIPLPREALGLEWSVVLLLVAGVVGLTSAWMARDGRVAPWGIGSGLLIFGLTLVTSDLFRNPDGARLAQDGLGLLPWIASALMLAAALRLLARLTAFLPGGAPPRLALWDGKLAVVAGTTFAACLVAASLDEVSGQGIAEGGLLLIGMGVSAWFFAMRSWPASPAGGIVFAGVAGATALLVTGWFLASLVTCVVAGALLVLAAAWLSRARKLSRPLRLTSAAGDVVVPHTEALAELIAMAREIADSRVRWIHLTGPDMTGKSLMIEAAVRAASPDGGVIRATTPTARHGEEQILGPIANLLAQLGVMAEPSGLTGQFARQMDAAASGLLGPIGALFQVDGRDTARQAIMDTALAAQQRLREQAAQGPVYVVFSQAQTLDDATWVFLRELFLQLPNDFPARIGLFLITESGRELPDWLRDIRRIRAKLLTPDEQVTFLREGYRLSAGTAREVMRWVSAGRPTPSATLSEALQRLEQSEVFEDGPAGRVRRAELTLDGAAIKPVRLAWERADHPASTTLFVLATADIPLTIGELSLIVGQAEIALALAVDDLVNEQGPLSVDAATGLVHFRAPADAAFIRARSARSETAALSLRTVERRLHCVLAQRPERDVEASLRLGLAAARAAACPEVVLDLNVEAARLAREQGALSAAASALARAEDAVEHGARDEKALERFAAEKFTARVALDAIFRRRDQFDGAGLLMEAQRYMAAVPEAGVWALRFVGAQSSAGNLDAPDESWRALGGALLDQATAKGDRLLRAQVQHALALIEPAHGDVRIGLLRAAARDCRLMGGAQGLRAELADSLGQALVYKGPSARHRAVALFRYSIRLKNQRLLPDLAGVARSLGGLGRALLEMGDARLDEAREAFLSNLELSRQLGDEAGAAKAYCHLGQVAQRQGALTEARESFERCLTMAATAIDLAFAFRGLIETAGTAAEVEVILTRMTECAGRLGSGRTGFFAALAKSDMARPRLEGEALREFVAWEAHSCPPPKFSPGGIQGIMPGGL